jgi:predicted phage-related endonuclease
MGHLCGNKKEINNQIKNNMSENENKSATDSKTEAIFKMVGDWAPQSKNLKAKFPVLTDSDLKYVTGKEDELVSSIMSRLHKKREEVISIIKENRAVETSK